MKYGKSLICLLYFVAFIACKPSPVDKKAKSTTPGRVLAGNNGKNQITLTSGWQQAYELNKGAEIQAYNPTAQCYLICISDNKSDFPNLSLEQHSQTTLKKMLAGLKNPLIDGPKRLNINGRAAIQYEVHGTFNSTNVVYLHTTIETDSQYNQIVTWTEASKFDENRAAMEQIIKSFQSKKA